MINKKTAFTWALILVIVTSMVTYSLTNVIDLAFSNKVLISKEQYKSIEKLLKLRSEIKKYYVDGADTDKLMEGALKGMFQSLGDPYSVYLNAQEFKSLNEQTSGSYGGIGIYFDQDDDGFITVVAPIEGTPAEKAGIKTNDKIVKVDGQDVIGIDTDKAVVMMKGKPDTTVIITVVREGVNQPIDFNIKREMINIKYVKSEMLENSIGYIRISMFDADCGKEFIKAVEGLQNQNMKGLVIDLRQNPGGYVRECVKIADVLLDEGIIFYAEDSAKERETYKSKQGKLDIPFVVLVDGGSASASEIVSGAVKDRNAGKLIGTKTFGKGLVQNVQPLDDGSGYKLTIQKYFTPSGTSINKVGIEPDIVVEPLKIEEGQRQEDIKDVQLDRAKEEILKQIR